MRKKIFCLTLALLMLASLSACGGKNDVGVIGGADGPTQIIVSDSVPESNTAPEAAPAEQVPEDAPYAFIYKGVSMTPDAAMAPLLEALGEPLSYFETPTCALDFEGMGKIYTYGSFEIDTYPSEQGDFVSAVILKDDSITTPEGVMIGESADRIVAVYGEPSEGSDTLYTYLKGGSALRFILRSGEIASIEYISLITVDTQA